MAGVFYGIEKPGNMKTLEFLYQETQIHFLFNPSDKNVMVNATEMAKIFGKRTKDFLANQYKNFDFRT